MTFNYDRDVDALDIRLLGDVLVARTEQVDAGTLVDLDQHGRLVAIEVIHPGRRWPLAAILEQYPVAEEDAEVLNALWREPNTYPFAEAAPAAAQADAGDVVLA